MKSANLANGVSLSKCDKVVDKATTPSIKAKSINGNGCHSDNAITHVMDNLHIQAEEIAEVAAHNGDVKNGTHNGEKWILPSLNGDVKNAKHNGHNRQPKIKFYGSSPRKMALATLLHPCLKKQNGSTLNGSVESTATQDSNKKLACDNDKDTVSANGNSIEDVADSRNGHSHAEDFVRPIRFYGQSSDSSDSDLDETLTSNCTDSSSDNTVVNVEIDLTRQLTCKTSFEPKSPVPDEAECSSMSEPSIAGSQCDMLKSPAISLVSSDGVQDCTVLEVEQEPQLPDENTRLVHEFEIPQELCGLLIGRNGRYVKYVKGVTNADIKIQPHPYFVHLKSCVIMGTNSEISNALCYIRERFPLDRYPDLTLAQISTSQPECALPCTAKLALPQAVMFDCILSSMVTCGHFFLHQPTHPTYHTLSFVSNSMANVYNTNETPALSRFAVGFIVAAQVGDGWYRTEIMHINEDKETAVVKLLDFGGFATVTLEGMRQIRYDFSVFPFQAAECFLGNVTFLENEETWSQEAIDAFIKLATGIIQGSIIGYDEHSIPLVHLYTAQGASSVFINQELVNMGLARWIKHPFDEED